MINEIQEIITTMGNFGFSVVMCLLMFRFIRDTEIKQTEQLNKMTEALNNNTTAIHRLEEKLMEVQYDKRSAAD